MKTIGKITTFVVMVALIATAAINLAIHIKSGEVKTLLKPIQQEQEKTPEENSDTSTPEQQVVASWNK